MKKVFKRSALAAALFLSTTGICSLSGFVRPAEKIVEVAVTHVVEVQQPEPTFEELVTIAAGNGMHPDFARALLSGENAGGLRVVRKDSIRCEKSKEWLTYATEAATRLLKEGKIGQWEFIAQRDAMRCSYGPFQVAGWHAPAYGMRWADLASNLRKNADVGSKEWVKKYSKVDVNKYPTSRDQAWFGFYAYNGQTPDGAEYANKMIAALERRAFEDKYGPAKG